VPLFARRRRQEDLEQLVRETRAAAGSALAATGELRESIDALARVVTDLASKEERISGWRVVRLWAYVLVLLAVASVIALLGTKAFTDVSSSDFNAVGGSVAFYVKDGEDQARGYVLADYSARSDVTTYSIAVPEKYVGRDFALYLNGTAAMATTPSVSDGQSHDIAARAESLPCGFALVNPCQAIHGKVPPALTTPGVWFADFPDCASGETDNNYSLISVVGRSHARTSIDMFHEGITLPGSTIRVRDMGNVVVAPMIAPPLQHLGLNSCQSVEIDSGSELAASSMSPARSFGNAHFWGYTRPGYGVDLLVKRRDADRWANVALATAGVFGGLAVGLFPMATEAVRAFLRQRRRS
jgi:hypothetical protein